MNRKEPDETYQQPLQQIGEALSPYRLMEQYLKIYIKAFHYPSEKYETASLGQLIKIFQRHSDNDDLIQRLNAACNKRNRVAHKVIYDHMKHRTNPEMVESYELYEIANEGWSLVPELRDEVIKLKSS